MEKTTTESGFMADTAVPVTDTATRGIAVVPVITSHTPGPWRIAGDGDHEEIELCCVESATHDAIAIVADAHTDHGDPMPNARLIAAAPDLLAAAKVIASFARSWEPLTPGDIRQLTDAIAKAEGR